jgi:hypothetical protein
MPISVSSAVKREMPFHDQNAEQRQEDGGLFASI